MKHLLLVLAMSACVTTPPPVEPVQPEPTKPKVYPLSGWHEDYDALIISKVTPNMLNQPASRMADFCRGWDKMSDTERKQFYADLLYAIAYPESGYKNLTVYREVKQGIDKATGLEKTSEGMLQLSYSDALYYPCDFDAKKDLEDLKEDLASTKEKSFLSKNPERDTLNPIKNISCGVAIVDKLLKRDEYKEKDFMWTLGRYWNTARKWETDKDGKLVIKSSYKKVLMQMKARKSKCEQ